MCVYNWKNIVIAFLFCERRPVSIAFLTSTDRGRCESLCMNQCGVYGGGRETVQPLGFGYF